MKYYPSYLDEQGNRYYWSPQDGFLVQATGSGSMRSSRNRAELKIDPTPVVEFSKVKKAPVGSRFKALYWPNDQKYLEVREDGVHFINPSEQTVVVQGMRYEEKQPAFDIHLTEDGQWIDWPFVETSI